MKKIISVIIIALMLVTAFAACGKKTGSSSSAASGTSIGTATGSKTGGSTTDRPSSGTTGSTTGGSGSTGGSSSSGSTGGTTGSGSSGAAAPSTGTGSGKASGTDITTVPGATSPTDVPAAGIEAKGKESMVTAEPKDSDFASLVMNKGSREYDSNSGTVYSTSPSSCVKNKDYTAYDFEIKEAGTYTLVVKYVARTMSSGKRGLSYTFDDGKQNDVDLTPTGSDNTTFGYLLAEFTASPGKHTVKIGATADFNDSTVKSCDYYYIKVYKNK